MTDIYTAVVDIAHAPLNPAAALEFVSDPRFGGIATFIGRVRQHNHGRVVTGITYDLFDPLALRIFQDIGERARAEVGGPFKLYIAHAKGSLRIGDFAVVIAAATPHRDEAFRACRRGDRSRQARSADLEAGALRGWRQRLERGLLAV
jgi:molybdopterin synthase catalytic subunit